MDVTKQQVLDYLDADEVDYARAAQLGVGAIEHLKVLIDDDDELLASKATYLASMISSESTAEILRRAGASGRPTVRLAAVVGANALPAEEAEPLIGDLLADDDAGVRKQAILSATRFPFSERISQALEQIATTDPTSELRRSARQSLGRGEGE